MTDVPPLSPWARSDRERTEERLARLSVLQELTLAALDLFEPSRPVDAFLERCAERLGCLAALWLTRSPGGEVTLLGGAGLSARSRALPISATDGSELPLPYPELADPKSVRWDFPIAEAHESANAHAMVLFFERSGVVPATYRGLVERLVVVLRRALSHREVLAALRNSYDDLARAQQALVERERLAALGELAAVLAHEVRNPLGVIYNALGSLRRGSLPADDAQALLGVMAEEAERLNTLVGDLLDFARPQTPSFEPGALDEIVDDALAGVRGAQSGPSGVRIVREIEGGLPRIPVDATLLRQGLVNLVVNALQATPDGGTVTLRVRRDPDGQALVIEIEDTGRGIPDEVRERIFEPFFTTRALGTGLGLAVVKRVAEAHHGRVEVRSALGVGSLFRLRLPLQRAG